MNYIFELLNKSCGKAVVSTFLIVILWGALYHLTDFETITNYFWTGVAVCVVNTWIANLRKHQIKNIIHTQSNWIIMAGVVWLLFHAGFEAASVFVATAILVSPLFWASIYESFVGFSLLVTLVRMMI